MPFLNPLQKATLAAITDTLFPELDPEPGDDPVLFGIDAARLELGDRLEEAIENVSDEDGQRQLKLFLRLLEMPAVNWILSRTWGRFTDADLKTRSAILLGWGDSRLPLARAAFQSVKRLTLFLAYSAMPQEQANPTWSTIDYRGPPAEVPQTPATLVPLVLGDETSLETEVLVIGSGAGGGVVAGELAAAGHDVLVVDKGGFFDTADFHGRELDANRELFERSGALTTQDLSLVILAGSAVGGGTVSNWMTSLPPPDFVRQEWADDYGFSAATSVLFDQSLDAVSLRTNINTDESSPNRQNAILERGCREAAVEFGVIPRNVAGCSECGFCGFGCPYGAKQSTLTTYLKDAYVRGARILPEAEVERVLYDADGARGAELIVQQGNRPRKVSVRAKIVVVCAGSIHTPLILLRSGLTNRNLGEHLHLHPTTAIFSQFAEPVFSWQGPPQTRLVRAFEDLDGQGYGVWFEVAPAHPGLWSFSLPWRSGAAHKRLMQRVARFANLIVLTRDRHGGRVRIGRSGWPVIDYKLDRSDREHMMRGLIEAARLHKAAGAEIVYGPQYAQLSYHEQQGDFNGFLASMKREGLRPNGFNLFSAHQMSSCRIGGSPSQGVVNPEGETYEVQNLYVADSSIFPTAVGVNPMLAIMAAAHLIAQGIKGKF